MMPSMKDKPLVIPPGKKWKGLVVFCNKCKSNVYETCKLSGKKINQCKHGDQHVYKSYIHVPGTKNSRKTRIHNTREINEAIRLAIEFEKEIKSTTQIRTEIPNKKRIPNSRVLENKPILLVQGLARYIGWLNGEGVPSHLLKERSVNHIRDVQRSFEKLAKSLMESGNDLSQIKVSDIKDAQVGEICNYLREQGFHGRTFNKFISYYNSWLKWYNLEYNAQIQNCFIKVPRDPENPDKSAITLQEYYDLLAQITPENGIRNYTNKIKPTRSVYRTWLSSGIKLGLETGRRVEEISNLKWSDIKEDEGNQYIKVEDYKVNHIQKRNTELNKKYIYIPMTLGLKLLLDELGRGEAENSDSYILAPEIIKNRNNVISDVLCRGFTHYYEQIGSNKHLTFKSLRKAYITNLVIFMGAENARMVTGHSSTKIIDQNYLDKREMAKSLKGFSPLKDPNERINNLKETRDKKNTDIEPNIEL